MSDPVPPKPPPPPPPRGAGGANQALLQLDAPVMPPNRAVSGPIARVAPPPPVRAESGPVAIGERASLGDAMELDAPLPCPTVVAAADDELGFVDVRAAQGRPEHLVSLPAPPPAGSVEEQLERRRARVSERIATARDALGLVSDMAVSEDSRNVCARALRELQAAVGGSASTGLLKDPKAGLAAASKEVLDAVEPLLGPIEDKLLALDEQMEDAVFEARAPSAARNKKVLVRYGRLLASRRMPVGGRRNRFEWLAMQLLTRTNEAGQLLVAPPEGARVTLQQMVGDLPRKIRRAEIDQATDYLFEAGERLDALQRAEELFESGLYADVHGHKVSMREHVLSAEFVYRIALFEAKLHNHVERWVAAEARAGQADGAPDTKALRARLRRRLRAERDDVDSRLGARPKAPPSAAARTSLAAPKPQPGAPPQSQAPQRKRASRARVSEAPSQRGRLRRVLGRALLIGLLALLVIAAATFIVRQRTGVSSDTGARKLTAAEVPRLSPVLLAGNAQARGGAGSLQGSISGTRCKALDPDARRDGAARLA